MPLPVLGAYVVMILIWGTTWSAIKVGITDVPPFLFAFERALTVSVILTAVAAALRLRFPWTRGVLVAAAVAGVINIGLSWALIFWAEQYVPSGIVAVFGATSPVWTAFLAHFLVRGDRLSWLKLAALGLGVIGTAVLVGAPTAAGGPETIAASALLALLPIAWAIAAIITARALATEAVVPIMAIEMWAGTVVLVPFALTDAGQPSAWTGSTLVAFAFLVIFGSCIGHVLNLWLYSKLRPTTIMLSQVLIPVQAVLIGAFALGESLTASMLVGAALVFAAVGLNARAGGDSEAPARSPAAAPAD